MLRWSGLRKLAGQFWLSTVRPPDPSDDCVRLVVEPLEDRRVLSATAALIGGELQILGDPNVADPIDDVEIRYNGDATISVLDDGVEIDISAGGANVQKLELNQILSIQIDLGDGIDKLALPVLDGVASITAVDAELEDQISLSENDGLDNVSAPALDLSAGEIRLGGALGTDYSTAGLTLVGNVILDGSVSVTTADGDFDASAAVLSASVVGADLTIDTGDGDAIFDLVDDSAGEQVDHLNVTNADDVLFDDAVTVNALSVSAQDVTIHDDISAVGVDPMAPRGVTLAGNVNIDGDVSITTKGGEFDASAATLSSSLEDSNLSVDTAGGDVTFDVVGDAGGEFLDHLTVTGAGDVLFGAAVSVAALSVDGQTITIRDNVETTDGILLESIGLLTIDRAMGNMALTIDTNGADLTLISGVTDTNPFVIGRVSFLSTGGGGTVTIGPADDASRVEIGTPGASVSPALWLHDLDFFSLFGFGTTNGFAGLTIGSSAQSGQIGVFESLTIGGDLHLHAGMGAILLAAPVTASGSATFTGDTTISGGAVNSGGNQTYDGDVLLGAAAALASSGMGTIALNGTVNGAHALTVNTSGTTRFDGVVGGSAALASLTTDMGGTTVLNGNVTTTGAQTYNDDVLIDTGLTLATTNSAVTFGKTVNSQTGETNALTVNAGTGTTRFGGVVGGSAALASLTTDMGGTTELNGNVTTTGAQTYNDDVLIDTGLTLATTDSAVTFGKTVNSQTGETNSLTVNAGTGTTRFGGVVGGSAALASLTTDMGGTTELNGNVTTTGAQTYNDDVLIDTSLTLATTDSAVTFGKTVNSQTGETNALTVNAGTGTTRFGGVVGGSAALASLTTDMGGTTELNGNVTTTGAQTYNDDVLIDTGLTLTTTDTAVTFGKTVNSQTGETNSLTVNAGTGTTRFGGAVGAVDALASLTTDMGGTTELNGNVTTTGAQTYNDDVVIDTGLTLATTDSAVTFGKTVNSQTGETNSLTVNTGTGTTRFDGVVGAVDALASLTTDAGGTTEINGGAVNTTGGQTYGDAVLLGADAVLASSGMGTIAFGGAVDGPHSLTVNTTGTTRFGGAVGGGDALTSLTTDAGGTTQINGGAVNTTAGQTYGDAVLLGADAVLASSGMGTISFNDTVDGAHALTVNTAGTTRFAAAVGGGDPLSSVTTDAGGTTEINGGEVSTTGDQTYGDAVLLGADAELDSSGMGTIAFNNTLDGAHAINVDTAGTTRFGGVVGGNAPLSSVTTDAGGGTEINGGAVNTTGGQTYGDAVLLGAGTVLSSSGMGTIAFGDSVDGAQSLTVNTGGTTRFGGAVGVGDALTSLATDVDGTTEINGGAVNTTGSQTYGDAVLLGADAVLASSGMGTIAFSGTLDGGHALSVNTAGTTRFGTVGNADALASLTTDASGTTELNGDISTFGVQAYNDAVTLIQGVVIDTTSLSPVGAAVTFGSTLSGQSPGGQSLTLIAGTGGDVTFAGDVGSAALGAVTITLARDVSIESTFDAESLVQTAGTGTTTIDGATTLSGIAGFDVTTRDVVLGADGRIVTTSGNVDIAALGTVDMQDTSLIDAGGGTVGIAAGGTVTLGAVVTTSLAADAVHVASATGDISLQQQITAGSGGVRLTAGDSILDANDGSTLITAADLWLTAGSNIGRIDDFAAGTGDAIDIAVSGALQQAVVNGPGDIFLNVAGDLTAVPGSIVPGNAVTGRALIQTTGNLDLATVAGIVVLDSGDSLGLQAGGTLTVPDAGFNVGTGDLRLAGQDVLNAAGNRDLGLFVADTLSFASGADMGTTLGTQVNTLRADLSGAGSLTVNEMDGIALQSIVTSGGAVTVNAGLGGTGAGSIAVQLVDAGTAQVVLNTVSGSILDGDLPGSDGVNIMAGALALRATSGIGAGNSLEVAATTLAATTVTGDIDIVDTDGGLIIGTVDGTSGVSITGLAGGDVSLTTLGAAADLAIDASVTAAAGMVSIASDGNVTMGAAGAIDASGAVQVDAAAAISMADGAEITADGIATLTADGSVTLGLVTSTSDVMVVSASGAIVAAAPGSGTNIAGDHADLQAATGIAVNTGLNSIAAETTSGGIMISEADGLLVQSVVSNGGDVAISAARTVAGDLSLVQIDAGTGQVVLDVAGVAGVGGAIIDASDAETDVIASAVALRAASGIANDAELEVDAATLAATTVTGDVNVRTVDSGLTIGTVGGIAGVSITGGAAGDDVSLIAPGTLTVQQNVSNAGAGMVTLDAVGTASDVAVNATVSTVGGAINLSADNDLLIAATGAVASTSGAVQATAGNAITMADGSVIDAGSGAIGLQAAADVALGLVRTTTLATVISTSGGIVDGGDIGVFDVVADRLALSAQTGIGSGNPLETSVSLLSATSATGDIQISNDVNGLLTIGAVGRGGGVTAGDGDIAIDNVGALTVAARVASTTGDVALSALSGVGDLTINAQVTAGEAVELTAGRDLAINDSGFADDVSGNTIAGDATRNVTFEPNVIVRSQSGAIAQPEPFLQITSLPIAGDGTAQVDVVFGRPGESNFEIQVDFAGADFQMRQFANPGTVSFSTLLTMPPPGLGPADPVPITVTLFTDPNITFTAGGLDLSATSETDPADAPALGYIGAFTLDLDIGVPQSRAESQPIEPPPIPLGVVPTNQTEEIDTPPPSEQQSVDDVLVVIVEKIGPDGQVELTPDGRPIIRRYEGDAAAAILKDRLVLFEVLRSGRFRAWLQEGANGAQRLLWNEMLRDGRPAEGSEATRDRPPTESTGQAHDSGETDADPLPTTTPDSHDLPADPHGEADASPPGDGTDETASAGEAEAGETAAGALAVALSAPSWSPLAVRGRRAWRTFRSRLADVLSNSSH